MSDLIKRAAALELLAMLPTSIGPGGAALSIPPEVFRRNAQDAIKAIPPATALAEAQAEIARLEDVLEIVAAGPILGEPMARWINHMMAKARAALSRPHATKGEAG